MPVDKCRVCGDRFFDRPLLHLDNMPRAAQFLPDASSVEFEKGIELDVCQCVGCGLVQLTGNPVSYYKDVIRSAAFSDEMMHFRFKQFSAFIEKFSLSRRKLIEIGCGRGEYLSIIKEFDVEVSGLEHLHESVILCSKNGLDVTEGFMGGDGCSLKGAPYDAFMILNYFEHLPEPNSSLSEIRDNLKDGAIGLVEVPNFDMIIKAKLFSEFTPDHIFYFTKGTLATALNLNGFDVIGCEEIWHDYIISATVRKRGKLDLSSFHENRKRLEIEINEFISKFKPGKVAIWGAGHQAFAVISMTGISEKIKYVVDSAPFKQNRYTPATHIPILAPETLISDPVDSVIVMAAGYSDEVATIIRNKYNKNITISILRENALEIVKKN